MECDLSKCKHVEDLERERDAAIAALREAMGVVEYVKDTHIGPAAWERWRRACEPIVNDKGKT